jgi:short-subunit dehydrogenase
MRSARTNINELINAVFDTNLRGPYHLSREVARRLIAKNLPGRMVNISSMGAYSYNGGGAALYSITKAGIVRMTEALAVEWARFGINVNCIAPGAFASEMMDGMLQRIGDITKNFPRKRLGDPAQLDSTLLYLVSPSSEFVTGTVAKVDEARFELNRDGRCNSHQRRQRRYAGVAERFLRRSDMTSSSAASRRTASGRVSRHIANVFDRVRAPDGAARRHRREVAAP